MKIVLLGSKGQVGSELQRALAPLGTLVALSRETNEGLCGDLEKPQAVARTLHHLAPDVVVNAAAYTLVDAAETNQQDAHRINADAPLAIAQACAQIKALMVHYSTDYVFDGSGEAPWVEDDVAAPINVYGHTKWLGEQAVRQNTKRHLLLRTQWVYANRGNNFIRTMLRLATQKETLNVINDQHGAPTGAELIADATAHAVKAAMENDDRCGTYHLVASGETTWFDFARLIIGQARDKGWPVTVAEHAIHAVPSSAFETAATRPHNSRLATEKLEAVFGLKLPPWQQGAIRAIEHIMQQENAQEQSHA